MRLANLSVVGLVVGFGVAGCAGAAPSEGTDSTGESVSVSAALCGQPAFLAIGDSIAFGYDPLVTNPTVPSSFVGYPDVISSVTRTPDVNASCPGETSGSFLSADAPDNGCRNWKSQLPLHTQYAGTQASFAFGYVAAHPEVKYVTFNIGANDLFLVQQSCNNDLACIQTQLPIALQKYGQNVGTIFGGLKQAGFKGTIVALSTYSTNYNDALSVQALTALNGVLTQVATQFGYPVADGYGAFKKIADKHNGDSCAAGLLIKLPDGTCNIHPSKFGRDVLAATVGATALKSALSN